MEKKSLKKSNRVYLRKVFTVKALFYPVMVGLVKIGVADIAERFINRIVRAAGIKKSVHYFIKYRDYAKLFTGHFGPSAGEDREVLFPMMFGVHSNFTMLNLLLAKYFLEKDRLKPVFYICDAALGICTKDGMLKSRERHPWFCHECWSGYRYIAEKSGVTTDRMSRMLKGHEARIEKEAKTIRNFTTLRECNEYRYDGIDIGDLARKSVLRYFLEGRLAENDIVVTIYRKFLIAGVKYSIAFSHLLKERPGISCSFMNNGSLLFEAIAREHCSRKEIPYMTYETYIGNNSIIYKKNGPVMDLDWSAEYKSFVSSFKPTAELRNRVAEFFDNLRQGKEMYAVLNTEHNDDKIAGIGHYATLFTNLNYDTAVIDKNSHFNSMEEWIFSVIEYWKRDVTDIKLVIRIHPGEIKLVTASREFLGDRIRAACGDTGKIIVFDSDEKVNSYELINGMDYGLIYSSTIGLEIAYTGKTCVVAGLPWFRDKSFVICPGSRDAYFRALEELNSGRARFLPDAEELLRTIFFVYFNRVKRLRGLRLYTPYEEPNSDFETSLEMINANRDFFDDLRDELFGSDI